jgi:hypothetical protein
LVLAKTSRLKGAAAILSLFFFIVNSYKFPRPVNLKMADGSIHIVVTGKSPTGPQKLQHLRNGIGRQLVNLNIVSRQDIRKLLGHWQTKPRGKEIPKDHALILSGLRRGFLPR